MTIKEKIVQKLRQSPKGYCDDCLTSLLKLGYRQQANQRCNMLAKQKVINRSRHTCPDCGRYKLINTIRQPSGKPTISYPNHVASKSDRDRWDWEGNVQESLVTWLKKQKYTINRTAQTSKKEQGKDIIATRLDGRRLWVTVKGYPRGTHKTKPPTQARHWFSQAVFDLILYHGEDANVDLAIGLPVDKQTYARLSQRVKWLRRMTPFSIFWVSRSGNVTVE